MLIAELSMYPCNSGDDEHLHLVLFHYSEAIELAQQVHVD